MIEMSGNESDLYLDLKRDTCELSNLYINFVFSKISQKI